MTHSTLLPLFGVAAVTFAACDRRPTVQADTATPVEVRESATKTLETARLGKAVDLYQREPTSEHAADVKRAMAELDKEIAELEARIATSTGADREEAAAKAQNLRSYRTNEGARFQSAQVKAGVAVEPAGRSGAQKVEDTAERVGNSIEKAGQKVGDAIKDAVR